MASSRQSTRRAPAGQLVDRDGMHQIGEVAQQLGLSLRTVRYYEEVGLVIPSGRTPGGFRLYTAEDVERLALIKRMKPLGFSLDEMRELLSLRDSLARAAIRAAEYDASLDLLRNYAAAAAGKCESLRKQLEHAEAFADTLRREVDTYERARRSPSCSTVNRTRRS